MTNKFFNTALVILLTWSLSGFTHVEAKVPDNLFKQKNSVVKVHVRDRDGNRVSSATGFIVHQEGIIATDCRIINKWFEKIPNILKVEFDGGTEFTLGDLISPRCANNLVLLTIDKRQLQPLLLNPQYKPKHGEEIFVIGGSSGNETNIVGGAIRGSSKNRKFLAVYHPITLEESGSPVFNRKGQLIGAAIYQKKKGKKITFVAPLTGISRQLNAYLKKRALPRPSMQPPDVDRLGGEKTKEIADQEDAHTFFYRGCSYEKQGMYREAISAYKQSLKLQPDLLESHINLGISYFKLGKYESAISSYKEALVIKPDSVSLYNKLGAAYIMTGSYELALQSFKKAVAIEPKNATSHFNLGVAHFLNEDDTAAFSQYKILQDIDITLAENLKGLIF
jgi:tetratricopeptide (TPR) repeat protein